MLPVYELLNITRCYDEMESWYLKIRLPFEGLKQLVITWIYVVSVSGAAVQVFCA